PYPNAPCQTLVPCLTFARVPYPAATKSGDAFADRHRCLHPSIPGTLKRSGSPRPSPPCTFPPPAAGSSKLGAGQLGKKRHKKSNRSFRDRGRTCSSAQFQTSSVCEGLQRNFFGDRPLPFGVEPDIAGDGVEL